MKKAPIFKNNKICIDKLSDFIGIEVSLLKRITVDNIDDSLLVSIVVKLWELTKQDEKKCKYFLMESNSIVFGLTPIEFIKMNPRKNTPIIESILSKYKSGELMGS